MFGIDSWKTRTPADAEPCDHCSGRAASCHACNNDLHELDCVICDAEVAEVEAKRAAGYDANLEARDRFDDAPAGIAGESDNDDCEAAS